MRLHGLIQSRTSNKHYICSHYNLYTKKYIHTALECNYIVTYIFPYISLPEDGIVEATTFWTEGNITNRVHKINQ